MQMFDFISFCFIFLVKCSSSCTSTSTWESLSRSLCSDWNNSQSMCVRVRVAYIYNIIKAKKWKEKWLTKCCDRHSTGMRKIQVEINAKAKERKEYQCYKKVIWWLSNEIAWFSSWTTTTTTAEKKTFWLNYIRVFSETVWLEYVYVHVCLSFFSYHFIHRQHNC